MSGDNSWTGNMTIPTTTDFNGYNMPVYDPPCACDNCPTCGRPRSWWQPWWVPRYRPIWQVVPERMPYFTNVVSATA